ncbi:hypothetical protein CRENBAI_008054 [Crenichthys baileyi]|uniref:Homeobox domain-containing protein n=1 Tax=Crenichthys baileyi TaxID=28760 RepID=A0AAV9RB47_9TELE
MIPQQLCYLCFVLLICRFLAPPFARCLGVKNRLQVAAAPSPQLDSFYTHRSKQPTQSELVNLMVLCGKTQRQIESWFRVRRNQDRPSQTKKFAEAALVAFIPCPSVIVHGTLDRDPYITTDPGSGITGNVGGVIPFR